MQTAMQTAMRRRREEEMTRLVGWGLLAGRGCKLCWLVGWGAM